MTAIGVAATLAAALAIAPLSPGLAQPRLTADPDLAKSDAALLQDEAKATAELQRRLRDQVKSSNGLLLIQDRTGGGSGLTVMPATIAWGLDCSDGGIVLTFGTGNADTDNGIALTLTSAAVSDEKCQHIAPALGETVLAITKGDQPRN
jgi:hypothetical protein